MFLFGLKMLWEAWRMDSNEAEETQKEVEMELGVRKEDSDEKGDDNFDIPNFNRILPQRKEN